MQIPPVTTQKPSSQPQNKRIWKHPLRDTGYASAALGIASGIAGSRKKIKMHKYLAYASGFFMLAHIGIAEYYKHKKSK